jgi:hypothetical protein
MKGVASALFVLSIGNLASAQECVPCDGKCLTPGQVEKLRDAVDELKDIHESPVVVKFQDPVVVIRDWDGRVYVNGGSEKPLRLKVTVGEHVDRDVLATVESRVWYKPEPESPMFRLRIRAQAGVLIPEVAKTVSGDEEQFWDGGIGWDFFHIGDVNLAAFTGVRSVGIGPGIDVTKNFGFYAGYAVVYDGFSSSALATAYFSFN